MGSYGVRVPAKAEDVLAILKTNSIDASTVAVRGDNAVFETTDPQSASQVLWDHGFVDVGTVKNRILVNLRSRFKY